MASKICISLIFLIGIFSITHAFAQGNKMELTSLAFNNNGTIPLQYSCQGKDVSPPLKWQNIPAKTVSFVLIMDDPDAPVGIWDHWILFNIPKNISQLPENLSVLPEGIRNGKNSWGNLSYGGPCPPSGEHRYFFKLYALDILLNLPEGSDKSTLETAMQGHILEKTELMGRFKK